MYGKLFESMYDGTLSGNWKALITFQQLIILADKDGYVDITPAALSRRTGIPTEIIQHGIEELEQPDKDSRSDTSDGRRIVRLDDHRPWGWQIVNYEKYRDLYNADDRREKNRARQQKHRDRQKGEEGDVTDSNASVTDHNAALQMSRHVDVDANTDANGDADSKAKAKEKKRGRGSRFAPKDFHPTDDMKEFARELLLTECQIEEETAKFKDYEYRKPLTDFNRAWRNWIRKSVDFRVDSQADDNAHRHQEL